MRFYNEVIGKRKFDKAVLTIGSFDGVHLGHRMILSRLKGIAEEKNIDAVVITFNIHPRKVLFPESPPRILTSEQEKIKKINDFGIDNIITLNFTKELADMPAMEFMDEIIFKNIGVDHIVIGYDHAFGRDREGNFDFLRELSRTKGFGLTRSEPMDYENRAISSTWIRNEIDKGNIQLANRLLGKRYSIMGKVVKGKGRGSKLLGFPTANIEPDDPDKVIPKDGVYAVTVLINKKIAKNGMLNVGTNPTFENGGRTIEVNIFDFDADIYGYDIEVEFIDWIRSEVKFASPEELIEQLHRDKYTTNEILNHMNSR